MNFMGEDKDDNDNGDDSYIDDIDDILGDICTATTVGVDEDMAPHPVQTNTIDLKPTTFEKLLEDARRPLYDGGSLQNLNETFIALIPKVKTPKLVTDFRSISLCNFHYKIISKSIANRLNKVLPEVISPTQYAFVLGRLISNSVIVAIVAFEALHSMNNKLQGRMGYMAMKLNMSKAYDRIEWDFLQAVLSNGKWNPPADLYIKRDLSLYLFILCAEVLSKMLNQAEARGDIYGIPIARGQLHINHLFFADDSLHFCKANAMEWSRLIDILSMYEKASGQRLNKDKTSIQFSRNTPQLAQALIL
ncbi:uncharacterized protein LOC121265859 [Juglans microcarpa x Juglans regia]|uniref:uncharacterized protein LOC121265859 n=1 Tax=Juglans microcarpa x Juglans regia TaxID=2249226 RepID=UPI001B7EE955|nr:uncharacterized protein LOC121265859 [Juglans microcarpa x Juglans regia]